MFKFIKRIRLLDVIVGVLVVVTISATAIGLSFSTGEQAFARDVISVFQGNQGTPTQEGNVIVPEATPDPVVVATPVVQPTVPDDTSQLTYNNQISATNLALIVIMIVIVLSSAYVNKAALTHLAASVPKPALDVFFAMLDSALNSAKPIVAESPTKIDDAALGELSLLYEKIKKDIADNNIDPSFLTTAAKGGDLTSGSSPSVPPLHPGDAQSNVG